MSTIKIYLQSTLIVSLMLITDSRSPWSTKSSQTCGYEFCPHLEPDMINVHLVSHTHDDVGWLKTYEQYYWGQKTGIQRAGVQYILNSVIPELAKDSKKRFIFVETAFFWRWWTHQDDEMKNTVKALVHQGRLEFIGGGWSMNDEATTHYSAIIDQMAYGHRWLAATFGKCGVPRVAWQIDPFGHSREQANLFAQMNFDGLFFGRLDWHDKVQREKNKTMEMVWSGSDDLGERANLFTGVLPNGYNPPDGFCFDDTCSDEPMIDDPSSREYNIPEKVESFTEIINAQAKEYATNNLILTMGSDFQYQNAPVWFRNLDKLIAAMEAEKRNGSKINVFYSTPSCYLYSLYLANRTWTTKKDDFFPYGSDDNSFWTGYFVSRPALKYYERVANNIFQAVKQIHVAANLTDQLAFDTVSNFHQAMGILQHHDAVAGTEKQLVAYDYAYILDNAIQASSDLIDRAYSTLMAVEKSAPTPPLTHSLCLELNISQCEVFETNDKVVVTLYNPYAHEYSYKVRLPWDQSAFKVIGSGGEVVQASVVPIPDFMRDFPERISNASTELIFTAVLPALGFVTYYVERNRSVVQSSRTIGLKNDDTLVAVGKNFTANFDTATGLIQSITLPNGQLFKMRQKYQWYAGMNGNNSKAEYRASGAYIFRPNKTAHDYTDTPSYQLFQSSEVFEMHQIISDHVSQTIRIHPDDPFIEFDYKIGPIPINDGVGKEIISSFETDLKSKGVFYTDANGRQMVKRVRDFRPTWKYEVVEPVAGNYYPVNSRISLQDEEAKVQLVVLTDRSQGGASLVDGQLELMVHRRLLHDDAFGVDEALNEPGVDGNGLIIRGKHYVLISDILTSNIQHRDKGIKLYMAPVVTFAPITSSFDEYRQHFLTTFSFMKQALPANVHILTLEHINLNNWLVRLEHFYQKTDDPEGLSKPVKIDFRDLFVAKSVHGVKETIMTAALYYSEAKRLKWHTVDSQFTNEIDYEIGNEVHDFVVTLQPMQIRTFLLRLDD